MTCEHRFVPMPGSVRVVFCERCGAGRDVYAAAPKPAAPRAAKPRPQRRAPTQGTLPFGAPLPVGNGASFMDPGTPVEPSELAGLEARFRGARPTEQARTLEELAQELGLQREAGGDPPNTYRPGETEGAPWLRAPQ